MDPRELPGDDASEDGPDGVRAEPGASADATGDVEPNPPRTTSYRWLTAPKFGSAGSGGLELEPGPEAD
jgi:hypothetical protein